MDLSTIRVNLHNIDYKEKSLTINKLLDSATKMLESQKIFESLGVNHQILSSNLQVYIQEEAKFMEPAEGVPQIPPMTPFTYAPRSTEQVLTHAQKLSIDKKETKQEGGQTYMNPSFITFLFSLYTLGKESALNTEILALLEQCGMDWNKLEEAHNHGLFKNTSSIHDLCINLNELVKDKKITEIIGREQEVLEVIRIIGKKEKNNPALIGPAGVGKTKIAEGLAYMIENKHKKLPKFLHKAQVFSLNISELLSGTKFRGDFEQKLQNFIKEFKELPKKYGILPILFIDEIHSIMGAGNTQGNTDLANLIKPALSKGDLRCIGATTDDEWEKFIEQDKALKRRFMKVTVDEPTREETVTILKKVKKHYEKEHGVKYSDESIESFLDLAEDFMPDLKRPDKNLDLMDYTGSMFKIKGQKEVGSYQVEEALSALKKIPLETITKKEDKRKKDFNLAEELKTNIYGQDKALAQISKVLEINMAGFKAKDKPMGKFLLVGPSGVGKTETAKQLSDTLGYNLERIDMSEFMEEHSVSKLIGAPPGYVGFEGVPLLTKIASKNPKTIILLDEIEKAHKKVMNVFLQMMDNAKVTDSKGKELFFNNVIIMFTSNEGNKENNQKSLGLGQNKTNQSRQKKAINLGFSSEFRGRLDAVVHYNELGDEHKGSIVRKMIDEAFDLFNENRGMSLTYDISDKAISWLCDKSFNGEYGARGIADLITDHLKMPIIQAVNNGVKDKVKISLKGDSLVVK